jgi:hypothetical protein
MSTICFGIGIGVLGLKDYFFSKVSNDLMGDLILICNTNKIS